MALSSCPRCSSGSFEIVEANVADATYRMLFIQCSSCGCVVGTQTYFDPGFLSKRNEEALAELLRQFSGMQGQLAEIRGHLSRQ